MKPYTNTLTLNHRGKGIPYGGTGKAREDGDANYGFRDLKGQPQLYAEIPELQRDPALARLVHSINASNTGLFSVGCVSAHVDEAAGFRDSGYVEFALNSRSLIADATNYFPLFFHFDRGLHLCEFSTMVQFAWELEPVVFDERDDAAGFTCAIFINTYHLPSREEADAAWSSSLGFLGDYLNSVPQTNDDKLYG